MIYYHKKKEPTLIKHSEGTREAPWYWYEKTQGNSMQLNNSNTSGDNRRLYIRVKLLAGTEYAIGENCDFDGKIWLYDENFNELISGDDDSVDINGDWYYDGFRYTPSTTGIYIIRSTEHTHQKKEIIL